MKNGAIVIRRAEETDYPFILKVNEENVEVLSPMNEDRLRKFAEFSDLLVVAELDGKPAAFLIALREGVAAYDSENYLWFSRHYPQFLYIDRVVVDAPFRGCGLGRALYQEVFARAKVCGVPFVTAEIDTIPYNKESLDFHKVMGFHEVGVQSVRNNSVRVSLQEAPVAL